MNQAVLDAKTAVVGEIKEKIESAQSVVVFEYRGLSVAQVTQLRRDLRNEGTELKVYKNSLSSRAAKEAGYDELAEALTGPNAIAFSNDAVAPSKVLVKFAKGNDKLVLKTGIVEGKMVSVDTMKELAQLPNKDGMLSMLLSCLQAPVRSVACVLKAVADAKEEN
ncbi:MAG: 50S ribosomal protein L10 [Erysipelotrichaceae bacterium]